MMTVQQMPGAETNESKAYGCIFCMTGKEQAVADEIQRQHPQIRAIVAKQEKHKTEHGRKTRIQVIAIPSYVFFEAPESALATRIFRGSGIIRVLTTDNGTWQLLGSDERFARWLFSYGGLLGFSQACREGDRIRILNGPLKDLEGSIRRVDKRGRSGQVSLEFNGRQTLVWLGFDLVEDLSEKERLGING